MFLSKITSNEGEVRKLVGQTQAHFRASGWTINSSASTRCHYKIEKNQFSFFIICLEKTTATFFSPARLLFLLGEEVGFFRSAADRLAVFILGPGFIPFAYSAAATSGLCLVPTSEIELVSTVEENLNRLEQLSPRQELLLKGNRQVCLNIADQFWKHGNLLDACKWAELAVNGYRPFVYATKKLVEILVDLGDLPRARNLALDAAHDSQHIHLFAPLLLKIAQIDKNQQEIVYWSNKLKESNHPETGLLGIKTKISNGS